MRQRQQPADVQAATRDSLLEAAAQVFAEHGYGAATVREICVRAGANIAAVNYHFGSKETLYAEVLKHALRAAREKFPLTLGLPGTAAPEARLHAFIESLLMRVFDEGPHAWHGRLILREMIEPTAALDELVQEEIRPMADNLQGIIGELLGGAADEETVRFCATSIVSQCVFYNHCRPVLTRLFPKVKYGPPSTRALAEHITEFSLAGIRQHALPTPRSRR